MTFKVRALDTPEPKSVQEIENELLKKHEQEIAESKVEPEPVKEDSQQPEIATKELKDEDVLSYLEKKLNRQVKSFDELLADKKEAETLPPDIEAYYKYKKETGRGIEDFVKLNKDFNAMNPDDLLREYYLATEEGLEKEDIESMLQEFAFDEDVDDDAAIKKAKLAKKKAVAQAKKFFNQQKETYRKPLESSPASIPTEDIEELKVYKDLLKQAETQQKVNEQRREWFLQKTNELFDKDFKGFEFAINDKKITFSPGDAVELKKNQSTPLNFINKYLDENGLIKDTVGYHRSLAVAMNPERFAKFFYEQGIADATEEVMRKTKNINMSERRVPEVASKGGFQVKAVSNDSGHGLKIKKKV